MKSNVSRLILINLILISALTALHSQVIYFSGKNKLTNEPVKLDSVKIINNTLERDTTIYTDTFNTPWYTVINQEPNMIVNSSFSVDYYPKVSLNNLMKFKVKSSDVINLQIKIYNSIGVLLSSYQQYIYNRIYNIEITEPLNYGVYFVVFEAGATKKIMKFMKTNETDDNLYYGEYHPFNNKITLKFDSYTFIGYAKGFRRDSINVTPEDSGIYRFEFDKLGKDEYNWSIYLSSMSFETIVKEYNSFYGFPNDYRYDSSIYKIDYNSRDIDYDISFFDSDSCHYDDTNKLKFKYNYCTEIYDSPCEDLHACWTTLNFHFNIDSINNIIKELKIEFSYSGYIVSQYDHVDLGDSFEFILENIPFIFLNDNSIVAEVKAIDYKVVLKEFDNDYEYSLWEGSSHHYRKIIEWHKLNNINNDTFFRLVLSK